MSEGNRQKYAIVKYVELVVKLIAKKLDLSDEDEITPSSFKIVRNDLSSL